MDITSSFAVNLAPMQGSRPGYIYTNSDWSSVSKEVAANGDGVIAYLASKTFAERAAWDLVKDQRVKAQLETLGP